jgi:hypothetical protein
MTNEELLKKIENMFAKLTYDLALTTVEMHEGHEELVKRIEQLKNEKVEF